MHADLPIPASLFILAVLVLSLLCHLLSFSLHLYYRRECEKGSDVSNFLLRVLTSSIQVRSVCPSLSLVWLAAGYQPHWILPCALFNLLLMASGLEQICITLMCLIVCWFIVNRHHYTLVRQCVVRRIFGIFIIIFFSYPLFITIMVCDKSSFCPSEYVGIFDPNKKSTDFKSIYRQDFACRLISHRVLIFIKLAALIIAILCITIKPIIEWIKRSVTSVELENQELVDMYPPLQSAPLPSTQDTLRLRQSTLLTIIFLTVLVSAVNALVMLTRNIILSLCVNLVLTLIIPLTTLLLEKSILSFCLSSFINSLRGLW